MPPCAVGIQLNLDLQAAADDHLYWSKLQAAGLRRGVSDDPEVRERAHAALAKKNALTIKRAVHIEQCAECQTNLPCIEE